MTVRRVLAIALVPLLAACSATASSAPGAATSSADESASSTVSPTASASASGGTEIEAEDSDLGTILVDAEGNTIYFFANDEEGVSNCTADCLANWPRVVADGTPVAGDGVTAELGTLEVSGGAQLTVNGFPAYYFAGDGAAGDTNGQGVAGIWWVFGADGEPIEN
jgi:predicted lipoprotein with Yx(FWY)xxD motif